MAIPSKLDRHKNKQITNKRTKRANILTPRTVYLSPRYRRGKPFDASSEVDWCAPRCIAPLTVWRWPPSSSHHIHTRIDWWHLLSCVVRSENVARFDRVYVTLLPRKRKPRFNQKKKKTDQRLLLPLPLRTGAVTECSHLRKEDASNRGKRDG